MQRSTTSNILCAALCLGVLSACYQTSGSPKKTATSASPQSQPNYGNTCLYITNGIQAQQQSFPAVVFVSSGHQYCTGTLVGSNAVLTAAHCLDDSQTNGGSPQGNLTVTIGGPSGQQIPISRVYFPSWAGDGNAEAHDDLAVLVLSAKSAPAFMPIGTTAPKVGDGYTIAGYGSVIAADESDSDNPSELLYQGTNHVMALVNSAILSVGQTQAGGVSPPGQNSLTAPGDSGGPLIIGGSLVGVDSWTTGWTLTTDDFTTYFGQSPSSTDSPLDQESHLELNQIPAAALAGLKQVVASGQQLAIVGHTNLTSPSSQSWLRSLAALGVDIRFDTSTGCTR